MRELIKEVTKLSELIKNVVPVYDFATPQEKEQIIKVIFSELYISHNALQYKVKKGFETFDKRISSLCGQETWLSELYRERECIKSSIKVLQELVV